MPHHKSARKRLQKSRSERTYNRAIKSQVKKVVKATSEGKGDDLPEAYAVLDRAVKKGVFPANRATRTKSRLTKRTAGKSDS